MMGSGSLVEWTVLQLDRVAGPVVWLKTQKPLKLQQKENPSSLMVKKEMIWSEGR